MNIRLGYVAMTLNLVDCSPSQTVTATAYSKISGEDGRRYRLRRITGENLKNTLRILRYNKAYNIKVYRFTSKLVPLATHPIIGDWDYTGDFADEFKELGDFVKENDLRVSAHPDHYTLLNSPIDQVLRDSLRDLEYHVRLFDAMGLSDCKYKLVMHIGGVYKDKKSSIERFKKNFVLLPDRIRNRIMLENDDKSYTAADVLGICRELGIPMVLDVHHHSCANEGEKLEELLPSIFDTWKGQYFRPKIHFSSPRSEKDFRSHADFIDLNSFTAFIGLAAGAGRDFDIMLEAKNKDSALLRLSDELSNAKGFKKINEGEFKIWY